MKMKIILFSMLLSLVVFQGNGQNVNESKMTPNGNAQIFNFPVGTCFYTRNTYYKPIEQQSWTVLEIINITGDQMITKNMQYYENANFPDQTFFSKAYREPDRIIQGVDTQSFRLTEKSDKGMPYPISPSGPMTIGDITIQGKVRTDLAKVKTGFEYFNVRVTGFADVTVPAGTFHCYVLEYETDIKLPFGKKRMNVKSYISDAVGAVKTETLDNGDVYGVTELISVF
jgi:hypothetical protein